MMLQIEGLAAKVGAGHKGESEDSEAAATGPLSPSQGVDRLAQGLRCFAALDSAARHAVGAQLLRSLQPGELAAAHELAADLAGFNAPPPPMDLRPMEFRTSFTSMGGLFDL
jgi:hypothetical protein